MGETIHAGLFAFYLALFIWLIYRSKFFEADDTPRHYFAVFFLLKVVAGIALTLVYTYYYTDPGKADIYRYFNDSRVISPLLYTDQSAWFSIMTGIGTDEPGVYKYLVNTHYFSHPGHDFVTNNTFIIRVNVLLNYFSVTNIYINTLLLNWLSFLSLTLLYKTLRRYFLPYSRVLYFPLFLLPSVVFWSSGLLKENLLFACMGPVVWLYVSDRNKTLAGWVIAAIAAFALIEIKLQVACITIVGLSVFVLYRSTRVAVWQRVVLLSALIILLLLLAGDGIAALLIAKRNEFAELARLENAGSYLKITIYNPTLTNITRLLPEALQNSMLRPYVWEGGKLFQLLFALENTLFLLLIALLLFFYKSPTGYRLQLCLCFLFIAIANYVIIGITVPVLGAIVHYRVIATPFLLLAVLLAVDIEKLKKALFPRF